MHAFSAESYRPDGPKIKIWTGIAVATALLLGLAAAPSRAAAGRPSAPRGAPLALASASAGSQEAQAAAPQTLQLVVTNQNGSPTTAVHLGIPVNLAAVPSAGQYHVISWTLQGAGHLHINAGGTEYGSYIPPQTMPADSTVTITASLLNEPSVTSSFQFDLHNPVPQIAANGATPAQLLSGGTQTVSLVGTGFVPGMLVMFNGASLPTVFTSYTQASVQVPVPGDAAGDLTLQVFNPAPGGGYGSPFHESIVPNTLTLTATGPDGASPATATLGTSVTLVAAVTGSEQTAVTWSVAGAGSTANGGVNTCVYTAPAALPANNAVTITAALASNPAVTASYQLQILNPSPTIAGATPPFAPAGNTTAITLSGAGFVPGTTLSVSNGTVTATYQSATSMLATISVPEGATGQFTVEAQNPAPGGGASFTFPLAVSSPVSVAAAARILDQTTFGPTAGLIQHVQQEGVTAWLAEQFNTPTTLLPTIPGGDFSYCPDAAYECAESEWWQVALTGNDQLRQRVAFALSQLFVVSVDDMGVPGQGIAAYANMLANDAFTNWYTIMTDVTLSPAMGNYLNMLDSAKATGTNIANENFARENMQLFNIGLDLLNQDGSLQGDPDNPIPAYSEAQVEAFSRVFTGWTYATSEGTAPNSMIGTANWQHPMVAVEAFHDETEKALLNDANPAMLVNGTTLPPGQTAEQDLAEALTNVFEHPNVPPFVSKQLIQHLVTGNPSPGYISRVAAVFADDGNGVRGDMQAVLTAIFTDPEARAGDTDPTAVGGHLREPVLWMANVMRALGYVNVDPNDFYYNLSVNTRKLTEQPYASPAVFNFFPPDYLIPGTTMNSPEFALENTATVVERLSMADNLVNNTITGFNVDLGPTSPLGRLAPDSANLVDALNTLFMHGQMDAATRADIINAIRPLADRQERVQVATYLVISSPAYKIMH